MLAASRVRRQLVSNVMLNQEFNLNYLYKMRFFFYHQLQSQYSIMNRLNSQHSRSILHRRRTPHTSGTTPFPRRFGRFGIRMCARDIPRRTAIASRIVSERSSVEEAKPPIMIICTVEAIDVPYPLSRHRTKSFSSPYSLHSALFSSHIHLVDNAPLNGSGPNDVRRREQRIPRMHRLGRLTCGLVDDLNTKVHYVGLVLILSEQNV